MQMLIYHCSGGRRKKKQKKKAWKTRGIHLPHLNTDQGLYTFRPSSDKSLAWLDPYKDRLLLYSSLVSTSGSFTLRWVDLLSRPNLALLLLWYLKQCTESGENHKPVGL